MIHKYKIIIILLSIFCFCQNIDAQSSPRVSIQGTLKDANGAAAADSTYTVTFKLYYEATGGSALWTEEAEVEVTGGIYSHYLGSIVPLNSSNFNSTLFLGVNLGSYELSPRTELTYAPYAFAVFESECSGALGDIKYSMLNPVEFALENGSCWVPMDGRSIVGSELNSLSSINNVPDGGGMFLRAQEFAMGVDNDPGRDTNSPIATFQDHSFFAHNHPLNDPGHGHTFSDKWRKISGDNYHVGGGTKRMSHESAFVTDANYTNGGSSNIGLSNAGWTETRPKNINAWVYIRIN